MTIGIKEVARLAGVSTATVSRTLARPAMVSAQTRAAVMEAVRQTGYRTNSMASSLRRQRADAVLALVPDLGNPFFSLILSGIDEGLQGSGYDLLVADSRAALARGRDPLAHLRAARADGAICLDGSLPPALVAEMGGALDGQIVFGCEWVPGLDAPSVRSDNRAGAALAIDHLVRLGHRRIAHLAGPAGNVLTTERETGTLQALARHGIELPHERIGGGDFSLDAGAAAADWFLALDPRPTAVFCASDQLAIGLMAALADRGLSVPDDLSVVGFDDIGTAAHVVPRLTTIRQDRLAIGRRAARALMALLAGAGPGPEAVEVIPVSLIARHSTAAPPGED